MDLIHCEYCGLRKGKYREALRLRVCSKCLRWLKNRRGGAQDMSNVKDDYEELCKEGKEENITRAAEERCDEENRDVENREDDCGEVVAPADAAPKAAG